MGTRKEGDSAFRSGPEQVAALGGATPAGDRLDVLEPEYDVSGGLPLEQRPSLLAAVEGVERGRYRGIIVAYQSRLGRDIEYEEQVWRRVERAGGRIILALDGIDTTTADGRMVRRIRSAINHAERERHVETFERRRREATAAGIWQRRQTPRGYSRDPDTRRLVPDADAGLVAGVFRARAARATISELARRLGMTPSGVRALLRNRVYLGELRVGAHVNRAAHPAIVDVDTFDAVQQWQTRPARRVDEAPALLAGLIRCQGCGHMLSRSQTAAPVYAHPSSGRACPAPASITRRRVEPYVEAIARHQLERLKVSATEATGAVTAARGRLAEAEHELAVYLQAVSAADVGRDAFAAGARGRRAAVDEARDALDHAIAMRPGRPPGDAIGSELWDELDDHERNALLRGLIEVVIVRSAGGRGAPTIPVEDRVRVLARGAGVVFRKTNSVPVGIRPLPWPDLDVPGVLRVPALEDCP